MAKAKYMKYKTAGLTIFGAAVHSACIWNVISKSRFFNSGQDAIGYIKHELCCKIAQVELL